MRNAPNFAPNSPEHTPGPPLRGGRGGFLLYTSRDPSCILTKFDASRYALGMDTITPSRSLPVRPAGRTDDPAEPCCEVSTALPSLDATQTAMLADRLKALADP